jgi:hypothetical protein
VNAKVRRVERRAAERRKIKAAAKDRRRLQVPDSIKILGKADRGR